MTDPLVEPSTKDGVAATVASAGNGDAAADRFTHPDEVADLVALLASGRAGNTAGSDIVIDGGLITTPVRTAGRAATAAPGTVGPAMPDIFATGLLMGESPRWHDGRLWVCDWLAGEVLAFAPDGSRETIVRVDGMPFSIDWLSDGRLLITSPTGVVTRDLEPFGATGRPWNEIVVDPADRVYVDMPGAPPGRESRPGVVAVVTPDGGSRVVAEDVWFPNGMAVTPDGSTLILAESHARRLTAFTIAENGDLTERRVWASLPEGAAPDGICVDADGAVWYADVPNRHCVRVAAGGEVLATVTADRGCFACMLGGDDGRTLFVVANAWDGTGAGDGLILTERVAVPHAGRP